MGEFEDKTIKLGELLDTNINVFMFASLLFNGAYGFGGVKTFGDKKDGAETEFSKQKVSETGIFNKENVTQSSEFTKDSISTTTNFIKEINNG